MKLKKIELHHSSNLLSDGEMKKIVGGVLVGSNSCEWHVSAGTAPYVGGTCNGNCPINFQYSFVISQTCSQTGEGSCSCVD